MVIRTHLNPPTVTGIDQRLPPQPITATRMARAIPQPASTGMGVGPFVMRISPLTAARVDPPPPPLVTGINHVIRIPLTCINPLVLGTGHTPNLLFIHPCVMGSTCPFVRLPMTPPLRGNILPPSIPPILGNVPPPSIPPILGNVPLPMMGAPLRGNVHASMMRSTHPLRGSTITGSTPLFTGGIPPPMTPFTGDIHPPNATVATPPLAAGDIPPPVIGSSLPFMTRTDHLLRDLHHLNSKICLLLNSCSRNIIPLQRTVLHNNTYCS